MTGLVVRLRALRIRVGWWLVGLSARNAERNQAAAAAIGARRHADALEQARPLLEQTLVDLDRRGDTAEAERIRRILAGETPPWTERTTS